MLTFGALDRYICQADGREDAESFHGAEVEVEGGEVVGEDAVLRHREVGQFPPRGSVPMAEG